MCIIACSNLVVQLFFTYVIHVNKVRFALIFEQRSSILSLYLNNGQIDKETGVEA